LLKGQTLKVQDIEIPYKWLWVWLWKRYYIDLNKYNL
jgi:hypothetical protein